MADTFIAKIIAQLDTKDVDAKLRDLTKEQKIPMKIDLQIGNTSISKYVNQLNSQFRNAGQSAGQSMASAIQTALGSITTRNNPYTMGNLTKALAGFKFDKTQISTIMDSLDKMDIAVKDVVTNIQRNGKLNLEVKGVDELGRSVTIFKEFDQTTNTLVNKGKTIHQTFATMFTDLDASKLSASISTLDASFAKLQGSANTNSQALQQLKADLSNIGNIKGADAQIAEFQRISAEVTRLKTVYSEVRAESAQTVTLFDVSKLSADLESLDAGFTRLQGSGNSASTMLAQLKADLSGVLSISDTGAQFAEFERISQQAELLGNTLRQTKAEMQRTFTDVDVSKLGAQIATLDANFVKLQGSENLNSQALAQLKIDLENLGNIPGIREQAIEFERIKTEVDNLSISFKQAKAEAATLATQQQVMSSKHVLGNQITAWMNKNTKAAKIYRAELEQIQAKLQTVSTGAELKSVSNAFRELESTAIASGNMGGSVFGKILSNMSNLSPLFGMGMMITRSIRTVKDMLTDVRELDTALVDLQKTTTMSSGELNKFYYDANSAAKEMGVSTEQIISQAAAWSRLGLTSSPPVWRHIGKQLAQIGESLGRDNAEGKTGKSHYFRSLNDYSCIGNYTAYANQLNELIA